MLLECTVVGVMMLIFGFGEVAGVVGGGIVLWMIKHHRTPPATVVVEGNVGAGKSTFIDAAGGGVRENVSGWAPFLEWAPREPGVVLATQLRVLADYIDAAPEGALVERSWCSAVMFASLSLQEHDPRYLESYVSVVRALLRVRALQAPGAVVQIPGTPQQCEAKVQSRSQPGDALATPAFLEAVEHGHRRLYAFYKAIRVPMIEHRAGEDARRTVERARAMTGGTSVDAETVCEALDAILCAKPKEA